MDVWFAHEKMRGPQKKLVRVVSHCIEHGQSALVHAPTGLGKTAAVLAPALKWAFENNGTILFLTSRHTQHAIVLDTVRSVKDKSGKSLVAVSLMGKKFMCSQDNADYVHRGDFLDWCRSLRERDVCDFYSRSKGSHPEKIFLLQTLETESPHTVPEVVSASKNAGTCPYETALQLAQHAHVIVADYNYLFNPSIRDSFLNKTGKQLDRVIVVVDEAHNLPERVREMMSRSLNERVLSMGLQEAKKYELEQVHPVLLELKGVLESFVSLPENGEILISKEALSNRLESLGKFHELVEYLRVGAETVLEDEKRSVLSQIASFLELWKSDEAPFARIVAREKGMLSLRQRCLDPSVLTEPLWKETYSNILMSGTLSPTSMFRDIVGLRDAATAEFPSPFEKKNRLSLIIPRTTTRYDSRSPVMFAEIGRVLADVANKIPGCVAVFLPSYDLLARIAEHFSKHYKGDILFERRGMSVEEKQYLVSTLKKSVLNGAALLAVSTGSFGEGIDMPGVLSGVIVAGLPLERPTLEIQQRIEHYEKKFGKSVGRIYAYLLPALSKCFQNAGRCIRREHDKGALVFLEERFAWPMYKQFFPSDWDLVITPEYNPDLISFFRA